jgi:hypothetical protein
MSWLWSDAMRQLEHGGAAIRDSDAGLAMPF